MTRKIKLYRFLALVPSQEAQLIHKWCPLSQARNLSIPLILSLATRLPSQSHADLNGKELPRPPSSLLKKLLNFSYWLFSCWLLKRWKWATQSLSILSLEGYNWIRVRSHLHRKYWLISRQQHLREWVNTQSLTLTWAWGGKLPLWWMKYHTNHETAHSWESW